jgi:hypothetical protein
VDKQFLFMKEECYTMDIRKTTQLKSLVDRAKEAKENKYAEASRQRLDKLVSTKIRTAFIGALAAFEESYGFLWGIDKDENDLTTEELDMQILWEQTRTKVLNNGNAQVRAAQTEIANHAVKWNRYHIDLPVRNVEEQ